jgi:hypothetical protein
MGRQLLRGADTFDCTRAAWFNLTILLGTPSNACNCPIAQCDCARGAEWCRSFQCITRELGGHVLAIAAGSVDAPLLALPIALAQLTLQDLAGGCPRQCIDEID